MHIDPAEGAQNSQDGQDSTSASETRGAEPLCAEDVHKHLPPHPSPQSRAAALPRTPQFLGVAESAAEAAEAKGKFFQKCVRC